MRESNLWDSLLNFLAGWLRHEARVGSAVLEEPQRSQAQGDAGGDSVVVPSALSGDDQINIAAAPIRSFQDKAYGPPAHWLELVRARAPHLLDPDQVPSLQVPPFTTLAAKERNPPIWKAQETPVVSSTPDAPQPLRPRSDRAVPVEYGDQTPERRAEVAFTSKLSSSSQHAEEPLASVEKTPEALVKPAEQPRATPSESSPRREVPLQVREEKWSFLTDTGKLPATDRSAEKIPLKMHNSQPSPTLEPGRDSTTIYAEKGAGSVVRNPSSQQPAFHIDERRLAPLARPALEQQENRTDDPIEPKRVGLEELLPLSVVRPTVSNNDVDIYSRSEWEAEARWAALPNEVTTPTEDLEAAIREWERLQRLDREQRGT
jgi:hypothetical protein